eukprot:14704-Heterococcus_DN1.PRE.2
MRDGSRTEQAASARSRTRFFAGESHLVCLGGATACTADLERTTMLKKLAYTRTPSTHCTKHVILM